MKKLIIFVLTLFLTFTIILSGKSVNAELLPVTPFYGGDILNGKELYLFTSYSATPNFENGYISKKTITEQDVYYQENSYFNGWYKNLGIDLIDIYTEPEHEPENPYFYFYITFNNMLGHYMQLALNSLDPFEAEYIIKYSDGSSTQLTVSDGDNFLLATPENETTKEVVWLCWSVYYPDYLASFKPLTSRESYDFGFSSGENYGYNNGYNTGYSTGYNTGYSTGYNDGLIDTQYGVNTVVDFNQICFNGNFETNSGWSILSGFGSYYISNNRATTIWNGTATNWYDCRLYTSINWVIGHKYYVTTDIYSSFDTVVSIGRTGADKINSSILRGETKTVNGIITLTGSGELWICLNRELTARDNDYNYISKVMVIDLTQIYGEGNEPTSVDVFLSDFPSDYYAYTTSSLINIDYQNGYIEGQKLGYNLGYDDGKDAQATQQLTSTGWISSIFGGISSLLNIQIFPGVTIGIIVGIPFVISLAYFVIRAFRGGGGA